MASCLPDCSPTIAPVSEERLQTRSRHRSSSLPFLHLPPSDGGALCHPSPFQPYRYAAFFAALTFAHRARCAAPIFLRADADMVRLAGPEFVTAFAGCDSFRAFAHRARCACAIFRREAADTTRVGRPDLRDTPVPFKDSITEIA